MLELPFQTALIKAAKAEGGYAIKMSNRFLVGIPDLLVKLPDYPTCLIECKRNANKGSEKDVQFTPGVTALQSHNLSNFQKAGGVSGIAVLIDGSWPQLIFADAYDRLYEKATIKCVKSGLILRNKGKPWPIKEIIDQIVRHTACTQETV